MKMSPAAARLLACLGDPSRFLIVRVLSGGRRCVTELAADVGLSQSCTTRHLQALEGAGLVRGTREGRRVTFGLNQDRTPEADLIAWALRHESEVVEPATGRPGSSVGRPGPSRRTRPVRARRTLDPKPDPNRVDGSRQEAADDQGAGATPTRFEDLEDFLL